MERLTELSCRAKIDGTWHWVDISASYTRYEQGCMRAVTDTGKWVEISGEISEISTDYEDVKSLVEYVLSMMDDDDDAAITVQELRDICAL